MELANIPPPPVRGFDLGPMFVHLYGVMIALAVLTGVAVAQRCWQLRSRDAGEITDLALFAIPAGVIGGRMYHVVTDFDRYQDNWRAAVFIWDGGLGIWGAVLLGAVVAFLIARHKGLPLSLLLAAAAPALCFAQAVGRWGNYFNQELFGKPTSVPWALEVEAAYRPFSTISLPTYHPTFLYESIWCALIGVVLYALFHSRRLSDAIIFPLYVTLYCIGRFFIEGLRIDPAHTALGFRLNQWTALFFLVVGLTSTALIWKKGRNQPKPLTANEIDS